MVIMKPRADAPGEASPAAAAQKAVREPYIRLASRNSTNVDIAPSTTAGNRTTAVVEPNVREKRAISHATMGGLLKYPQSSCLDQSQ